MSIKVTPTTYPSDLMERLMFEPNLFPDRISYSDPDKQTDAVGIGAVRMIIKLIIQKLIELEVLEIKNRFIFFKNNSSNLFHDETQLTYFCFFIGLCVKHKIIFPYHLNPHLIEHLNHNKKFSNNDIVTICSIIDKKLCNSVLDINNKEILDGMTPYTYLRDFIDHEYNKNPINSRFVVCLSAILNISVPGLLQNKNSLQVTTEISGKFQISCDDFIDQLIFLNSCKNKNTFNRCKKMILEYINSLEEFKLAKLSEWLTENNTSDNFQIKIIDKIENYYIKLQVCFMCADFHTNLFDILDENIDSNNLTFDEIYQMNLKNMSAILDSHYFHENERKNMNDVVRHSDMSGIIQIGLYNNSEITVNHFLGLFEMLRSAVEIDELPNENENDELPNENDNETVKEEELTDEDVEEKEELSNENGIEKTNGVQKEETNDFMTIEKDCEQYTEISMKIIRDFEKGKKKFMRMENKNLGNFLALLCDEYIEYISLKIMWTDGLFMRLEEIIMGMNEINNANNFDNIHRFILDFCIMTKTMYETAEQLFNDPQMITKNVFKAIKLSYYGTDTLRLLTERLLEKKYDNLLECLKKHDNAVAVQTMGEYICQLGKYDIFD